MTIPTRYDVALSTLGDIVNALRHVYLQQNTEITSGLDREAELLYWINQTYALLENYDWSWAVKKDASFFATVASQSAYQLPADIRDKQGIMQLWYPTRAPLNQEPSVKRYIEDISERSGTGTPAVYCYIEKYETTRAYTTGTATSVTGSYTFTGVGTEWLKHLAPGDTVTIGANSYTVATVIDNTHFVATTVGLASTTATYSASCKYPLQQIDLDPIPAAAETYTLYYRRKFWPLIENTQVPMLPLNDRWVLVHGAWSLYQWFHNMEGLAGISPSSSIEDRRAFLNAPATIQKFYNQYVAKLLADDVAASGARRPRVQFKRGY